jgi:putative tryptophan/tyrosine transport system substrate-binding protein
MIGAHILGGIVSGAIAIVVALEMLWPAVTPAQPSRMARVGVVVIGPAPPPGAPAPLREAFLRGLRELGWIEGKSIALEHRYAGWQLERLPELAADLVNAKVDVIVTGGYRAILAAREATRSIPIVVISCDPVEVLVGSLARPGGNVTGSTCLSAELSPKKLQFLKEAVPSATRIAVLFNPDDPGPTLGTKLMGEAAPALGVKLQPVSVRRDTDVADALMTLSRELPDALLVYPDFVTGRNQPKILEFAAKHRLPAMYGFRESVDAGGLMSYGSNIQEQSYRAAFFVDKILKGGKPGDMPIEQPTRFELAVNLKTARALGLTIAPSVVGRADVVLE